MTSKILLRLIWKEYRVQRSLWLALLVAAVFLQFVIAFAVTAPKNDMLPPLFGIGIFLAGFFSLGSGAISFASEREDDTHIRLVSLTAPAGLTLLTKLATGALAMLAFTVATSSSAWMFAGFPRPSEPIQSGIFALYGFALANCLYALSWGVLCSLFCGRVITALVIAGGISAVSGSVLVSAVIVSSEGTPPSMWRFIALVCGICIVMWVVSYFVALGWLNRDFTSGPAIKPSWRFPRIRFVQIRPDGTLILPIESSDSEFLPVLSPEHAAVQPPPRVIRRWASWLFGGRGRQVFRFLMWRELVETRRVFWCGLALLLLFNGTNYGGIVALWNGRSRSNLLHDWLFTHGWLSHWFIALACGWMTFRQEQTDRRFLLLTYRGTKPGTIWLSKQCVWLLRLGVAFVAIHAVAILGNVLNSGAHPHVAGVLSFFSGWSHHTEGRSAHVPPPPESFSDVVGIPIAMLGVFAAGQAMSLFVRKTVVSAFFAFLAAVLLGCWIGFTSFLGVPLLCSTLPLVIGLFAATATYCRPWMMELSGLRVSTKPALFMVCGLVLCLSFTSLFRVTEIPVVQPVAQQASLFHSDRQPRVAQVARLLGPLTQSEMETAARYRQAITDFKKQPQADALAPKLEQFLIETAERPDCAFWHPEQQRFEKSDSQMVSDFMVLIRRLSEEGTRKVNVDGGGVKAALRQQLAAFAMCGHLMGRASALSSSFARNNIALGALREWAAHSGVTPELVDSAVTRLLQVRNEMPTTAAFRVARTAYINKLLQGEPEDWLNPIDARYPSQQPPNPLGFATLQIGAGFPGERERMRRLIAWVEREQSENSIHIEAFNRSPGNSSITSEYRVLMQRTIESRTQLERWIRTTPLARQLVEFAMSSNDSIDAFGESMDLDLEANFRGTILAMYLLAEHHGQEAPLTLELNRKVDVPLTDPWTGRPFDWFPDGLPVDAYGIPANTPFLSSGGSHDVFLTLSLEDEASMPGGMSSAMTGMGAASSASGSGIPFPIGVGAEAPLQPGAPAPAAVPVPAVKKIYIARAVDRKTSQNSHWLPIFIPLPKDAFKPRAEPAWKARVRE